MEISLKFPTQSKPSNFEPFQLYSGILIRASKDSVALILSSEQSIFTDENNTLKKNYISYTYSADKRIITTIPIHDLIYINKSFKNGKPLNTVAGVFMFLAAFNQLFLSPFFSEETRKTSDKLSAGTFGVGLVLAIIPKTKTYHFKQPKDGKKTLWQFQSN